MSDDRDVFACELEQHAKAHYGSPVRDIADAMERIAVTSEYPNATGRNYVYNTFIIYEGDTVLARVNIARLELQHIINCPLTAQHRSHWDTETNTFQDGPLDAETRAALRI